MRFLIFAENSREKYRHYHYRNTAAGELRRRIKLAGHESMTIEWFRHWEKQDLKKVIDMYLTGSSDPIIAVSNTFDAGNLDLAYLKDIFLYAKDKLPNLKIIHGGNRLFGDNCEHIDIEFLGRSLGMFDDWINNKDLSKYTVNKNPLILVNHNFDQYIDNPIVHSIFEDDCLDKNDVLGFEIGVGCRFNCTFCNYELRNSKIVNLSDPKYLHNFFDVAYNKYGITNFYCIDDTVNESEEKLSILAEALSNLNYHPNITAWARLDLLQKEYQRQLFKKINFNAVWFGIESFNPTVSKQTRKKTHMDHVFNSLEFMRDESPNTYTVGSLIVGLAGDSYEAIDSALQKVADEKLLNALQLFVLTLHTGEFTDTYFLSDLQKNPELYGYKMYKGNYDGRIASTMLQWENEWTNNIEAHKMVSKLSEKYRNNFMFASHSEVSSFRQMKLLKNKQMFSMESLRGRALVLADMYKQNYIKNKKKLLGLEL